MKTFQEWSEAGYQILKGSKASWVEGVAMFSEGQVAKITRPRRAISGNHWIGCTPKGTSSAWEEFDENDQQDADFRDEVYSYGGFR